MELLPDRFDEHGRPIDSRERTRSRERDTVAREFGNGNEMVEKVVRGVGEVVEGRKTWGELLRGLVVDSGIADGLAVPGSDAGSGSSDRDRDRRHHRRRSRSRGNGDY